MCVKWCPTSTSSPLVLALDSIFTLMNSLEGMLIEFIIRDFTLSSLLTDASHSRPSHDSFYASPYCKRSISPIASVVLSSPTLGALSYARADLLPSPKRIRSPKTATDLEGCSEDSFEPYVPREVGLGVDFEDESSEPSRSRGTDLEMDVDVVRSDGIDIDPETQAEIDECIAYADALRDRGIDARVVVEAIDREEIKMGVRGSVEVRVNRVAHLVVADDIPEPAHRGAIEVTYETLGDLVKRFHDHTKEISVRRVQVIESVQRDQGHRIVATGHQSADMLERIRELEQDNMRLRDMMDVASQRVARSQRRKLHVQREMRQIRHFKFYDRMRIARLEACARRNLDYHLGANRVFVSFTFSALLDVEPSTLDTSYAIELADGRILETIVILRGLWSAKQELLVVGSAGTNPNSNCCHGVTMKTAKQVEGESDLKIVPIVHDFLEVFPEDLPGIPPIRQVEFQIGSDTCAGQKHHGTLIDWLHTEMNDVSDQLKELSYNGFLSPRLDDLFDNNYKACKHSVQFLALLKKDAVDMPNSLSAKFGSLNWGISKSATEIRIFGPNRPSTKIHRRNLKTRQAMTKLTQKKIKFDWLCSSVWPSQADFGGQIEAMKPEIQVEDVGEPVEILEVRSRSKAKSYFHLNVSMELQKKSGVHVGTRRSVGGKVSPHHKKAPRRMLHLSLGQGLPIGWRL
ncbi:hypothetical protein Tco_0217528 [Tanacetum coccineum]